MISVRALQIMFQDQLSSHILTMLPLCFHGSAVYPDLYALGHTFIPYILARIQTRPWQVLSATFLVLVAIFSFKILYMITSPQFEVLEIKPIIMQLDPNFVSCKTSAYWLFLNSFKTGWLDHQMLLIYICLLFGTRPLCPFRMKVTVQ